jgi:hypothetical protein
MSVDIPGHMPKKKEKGVRRRIDPKVARIKSTLINLQ